jgi:hypothetical protein
VVKGIWVFIDRLLPDPEPWGAFELWAVPLQGSPRAILRYPRVGLADQGFVRHQIAPDGRNCAFATARRDGRLGLAILDIATGTVRSLAVDDRPLHDYQPVWSPDGRWLAFARASLDSRSEGVWLIGADGGGLRQLARPNDGVPTYLYSWTPDSRRVAFAQNVGHDFVDIVTGATSVLSNTVSGSASWRERSPRYVAQAWDGGNNAQVIVGDEPGGPRRVILEGPAAGHFVRWSPTRDEFLQARLDPTRDRSSGNVGLPGTRLEIVSSDGAQVTAVPLKGNVDHFEWTPDGEAIVYLHQELVGTAQQFALLLPSLRLVQRNGSAEREFFVSPPVPGHEVAPNLSIYFAVREYP